MLYLLQVRLLMKNTSALSKLSILRFIYDSVLDSKSNVSDISVLYRNICCDKWITGTVCSKEHLEDAWINKIAMKVS